MHVSIQSTQHCTADIFKIIWSISFSSLLQLEKNCQNIHICHHNLSRSRSGNILSVCSWYYCRNITWAISLSASPLLAPTSSHLGVREPGVVERLETVELGASSFNNPSMLLWVFMLGCWPDSSRVSVQIGLTTLGFQPNAVYNLHISFCIHSYYLSSSSLEWKMSSGLEESFPFLGRAPSELPPPAPPIPK